MNRELGKEVINCRCYSQWLAADGFLYAVAEKGCDITLDVAKEHVQVLKRLACGLPRPLLVDVGGIHSATKEARDYLSRNKESISNFLAVAVLVGSPVSRIIASFTLGITAPLDIPAKAFSSKEKAQVWLKGFLNEA